MISMHTIHHHLMVMIHKHAVATCGALLPHSIFTLVFPACQRSMNAWLVFKLSEQADTWPLRLGTDSATLEHKSTGHKSFDSFSFYHHSITTKDQYIHMAQC